MHSYEGENTIFNYNSDFSGDVTIRYKGIGFSIPGKDILEFVANCYIRPQKISEIENKSWKDLLI